MKKMVVLLIIPAICIFSLACKKENNSNECEPSHLAVSKNSSKSKDEATINELLQRIKDKAQINNCTGTDQFSFIGIGSKACGGPVEFIPYNLAIDTNCFYQLVNYYGKQMSTFNIKYSIVSDCSIPPSPKSVKCENSKPVLVY